MNEELNPAEEQVIETLLAETLGNQQPPDLSYKVLRRLAEEPVSVRRSNKVGAAPGDTESSGQKHLLVVVSVVATLAASLLLALWIRSGNDGGPDGNLAGNQDGSGIIDPVPESPQIETPRIGPADLAPQRPPRGIPLAVQTDDGDGDVNPLLTPDEITTPTPGPRQAMPAVTLVSNQVGSEMQQYWDAVGITPTPDASEQQIRDRLVAVLGIEVPADAVTDPEQLRAAFADSSFCQAVAAQWLMQITDGGLRRIAADNRNALIEELAKSLQVDAEFDLTLTGWLSGTSPNAAAFYAAVAAGRGDANDESAMIRRLASITMNVDLRCTRCHDSYIDGRGEQHDYWSFTALIRRGVRRSGGKLEIDPEYENSPPMVFYETSDGRQRVAEPEVVPAWLGRTDLPRIERVGDWTKTLIDSEVLARGVVNSLWQMVHGQPLRGRVVDPISAPHNDALDRLETNLVDDLIRSRFDVARTLTLIIASPVTRRGVPEVLLPANALVADESETREAMNAVDAFAAALPPRMNLPSQERVAQALRSVGASLDADGQAFVAQIGENGNNKPKPADIDNLASDFPHRANSVPVQWLNRIEDHDSRVEHLAYLAGLSRVPKSVAQASEVTREVEDENTALHRAWWMMRP